MGIGYLVGRNLDLLQRLVSGVGLAVALLVIVAYAGYRLRTRLRSADAPHV